MISLRAVPVVISAPSGAGKTTIGRLIVDGSPDFVFSVSATTRAPRPNERDGVDYDFVNEDEFRRMVAEGELVEWAEVHGHLYGTPRENLEEAGSRGLHVVLDIDVQGARQIRKSVPAAVQIFILPPSGEALVRRLTSRGTEERQQVVHRLQNAKAELLEALHFQYTVVNDDLSKAVEEVQSLARNGPPPGEATSLEPLLNRLRREIDIVLAEEYGDPPA